MLHQNDRQTLLTQRMDERDALLQLGRVEASQPFVEQQQLRRESQGASQLEALLIDIGQLRRRVIHLAARS